MSRSNLTGLDQIEPLLTRLTGGRILWQLLLVGTLSLLLFLPGFFNLPPVDRDEARFAQASRQMVETGDVIDIRLGEEPRYKKPIGIYWLQSTARALTGPEFDRAIWVYRLPSLAGAVTAVLLTYFVALSLSGARQTAFVASMLMAVTMVLGFEARIAKTDAVLLATVLGAQLVLARLWLREADGVPGAWPWVFWGALGLSMLIKGPVGPMVVALTIAVLITIRRNVRWLIPLKPRRGFLLFVVLVLPWYIAITIKSGSAFWAESLGRDLLGKIGEGEASKGAPAGYYSGLVWITFWPAAILLPFGFIAAWRGWREPQIQFLMAWILPTWIVFELTATKLPHYVLPTYPALATLAAIGWLARGETTRPGITYTLFLALMLLLGAVLWIFPVGWSIAEFDRPPTLVWFSGGILVGAGIWFTWTRIRAGEVLSPILGLCLLALGVTTAFFGHAARIPAIWPSNQLARIQAETPLCDGAAFASVGYHEPSILFLTAPRVRLLDAGDGVAYAENAPCALVFVSDKQREVFEAAQTKDGWSQIATVEGLNLGNTRPVRVHAYRLDES